MGKINKPCDDYFQQSIDYHDGQNGFPQDYVKAFECALKGHHQGDLNCTYLLHEAYQVGYGVPRDLKKAFQLAEEMESKHFTAAGYLLFDAYAHGWGVPLNAERAEQYRSRVLQQLSVPVLGVNEDVRYDALCGIVVSGKEPSYKLAERYAREYYQTSSRLGRQLYLIGVLQKLGCDELEASGATGDEMNKNSKLAEVVMLLDEGSRLDEPGCCWLKGVSLIDGMHYEQDIFKGRQLLRQAVERVPLPEILWFAVRHAADDAEFLHYWERYWKACRYGVSHMPREDELPCDIRVKYNPVGYVVKIPQQGTVKEAEILHQTPIITIHNEGQELLKNVYVRICCADTDLDKTIALSDPIVPGETVMVDPDDYELKMGDKLYVRVTSQGRYSEMILGCDLSEFVHSVDAFPPLCLRWEEGVISGRVLKITCTEGIIHNLVVTKIRNKATATYSDLRCHAEQSAGWWQFSDSSNLEGDEMVYIECDEHPSILGILCS